MLRVCLILFAYRAHPAFPLVLAANRDEFFERPTLPAAPWPESPAVFGGRDLDKGGSWLAVSARGRLAAVTNVRDGRYETDGRAYLGLKRDARDIKAGSRSTDVGGADRLSELADAERLSGRDRR